MTGCQTTTWFRAPVGRLAAALCVVGLVIASVASGSIAAAQPAGATDNHVLYWNEQLLEAFRTTGGAPTTLTHAGAIMHVAIYQAVNELTPTAAPYLASPPPASAPDAAQIEPAIDRAAYDTLIPQLHQRAFHLGRGMVGGHGRVFRNRCRHFRGYHR